MSDTTTESGPYAGYADAAERVRARERERDEALREVAVLRSGIREIRERADSTLYVESACDRLLGDRDDPEHRDWCDVTLANGRPCDCAAGIDAEGGR